MKITTIIHPTIRLFVIPLFISFLILPLQQAQAQESGYLENSEKYSREELAQMLAPIALYPDALLSQVLMASTYPIEVIEADRWIKKNPNLRGEALDDALLDEDWDPSVKAVCHFPALLALMSEKIGETTNLGNAFLAQEAEVMDMVQELRAKAYAQGNLTTTSEQKVVVEKQTIVIEPANPRVIYLPYYDPYSIYGPWWYPAYPPYYWGPSTVSIGLGVSYWHGFSFGFSFGSWSYIDWPRRYIFIDVHKRPRFVRHDRWIVKPGRWHHAPSHRRGVVYRDRSTAMKYGQYPHRTRDFGRYTRGAPEHRDRIRDRDRSGSDRIKMDRKERGYMERGRPERERVDRNRKMREHAERDRQERAKGGRNGQDRERGDRNRQVRERTEQDRQVRQRSEQERQVRQQAAQERQVRQRSEQERQVRQRSEQERQVRQRSEQEGQVRQRSEQERQVRQQAAQERQVRQRSEQERQVRQQAAQERQVRQRSEQERQVRQQAAQERQVRQTVQREQQQRSRGKISVQEGRRERQPSERGRISRQARENDYGGRGRADQGRNMR